MRGCAEPQRVQGGVNPTLERGLPPPPPPVRVPEPSVAARLLAEQAEEAESAPADYRTIRDWGWANGVDVSGQGRSAAVVARVNAARAEHGLPPFRLVNRPADADERRASADDGVAGGPQPTATIRAWARAHGVTIRDAGRLAAEDLSRVNAARRLLDLAPFEVAR